MQRLKLSARVITEIEAQRTFVPDFPAPREKRSSLYSFTVVVGYIFGLSALMHVVIQEMGVS